MELGLQELVPVGGRSQFHHLALVHVALLARDAQGARGTIQVRPGGRPDVTLGSIAASASGVELLACQFRWLGGLS
jgi:hypothetical protein